MKRLPDDRGYFGDYGGRFVPETLMAPLADILGLTRQTAVLAFQFGDGLSNTLVPTSGRSAQEEDVDGRWGATWFREERPWRSAR